MSEERNAPRPSAPGWDELWPLRRHPGPAYNGVSATRAGGGIPESAVPDTAEPTETDRRADSKLADLSKVMEGRHAELVARTMSELDAMRASMEAAARAVEERVSDDLQRVDEVLRAAARSTTLGAIEAGSVQLIRQLEADVQALRTEMLAAAARRQLVTTETIELRQEMDRLSALVEAHRAETATRTDLVALEDRVDNELGAVQSEVHSRLATLDAVVNAVDAAAATLDTRLEERLTGVANVAATTSLAPVRSDLRAVHDEVAATQRSIRELRRRVRTFLPRASPATGSPAQRRASSRRPSSRGNDEAS